MVKLHIRLTPRAARAGVDGWGEDAQGRRFLKVRVTAPPIEGRANAALIACLSQVLDVPKSRIAIVSGDAARLKTVEVDGVSEADLSLRLSG